MTHKKGFTLMEILFVLLVIALVMSFAMPIFRSVRYDVKNARAQAALKKLAEARRHYYQISKGSDVAAGSFAGSEILSLMGQTPTCSNVIASGVPHVSAGISFGQLFACGYLNWRDFSDLPYRFYICDTNSWSGTDSPCRGSSDGSMESDGPVYVGALGTNQAGKKYAYDSTAADPYHMFVLRDMVVQDNAK